MKQKRDILKLIHNAALKFLVPLAPDETYRTIVKEAIKISGATYGSIALRQSGKFKKVYSTNSDLLHRDKNRTRSNTYKAYRDKEPLIIPFSELVSAHKNISHLGIKWNVFLPLSYQKRSIGVLTLNFTKNKKITKAELNTLKVFGSFASLAIRKTQLIDESKKALKMRNIFISLAAHELRTPLTSINGYLQLMQKKATETSPYKEWVNSMYGESVRLTNLINELVEVNRMQSRRQTFNFSNIDLAEMLAIAKDMIQKTYLSRSVLYEKSKHSDKNFRVIGDKEKLIQVFVSLLDNAMKFSEEKDLVSIALSYENTSFVVKIKDTGHGISAEDLPHVFEGFYKGRNNQVVGMGLGLLLAKYIVEKHRGSIYVNSELGKETEVIIKLPAAK